MRRATTGALLAGVAASLAVAAPAPAQPVREGAGADAFCWRGRPLPRCRAFALFELGWFEAPATTRLREPVPAPYTGTRDEAAFGRQLSWTLGVMRNHGARTAVGGAAVLGVALDQGPHAAGTLRWRRWTGPATSVELAAGPGAADVPLPRAGAPVGAAPHAWRPAAMAEARANLADLSAVSVRGVVVPRAGGRAQGALFVGASAGSTAAAVGTAGLAVLAGIAIGMLTRTIE